MKTDELRRLGGKDASAALRAQIGDKTTGGRRANWPYVNDLLHVPYRGAGAAYADLLGGRVQVAFFGPVSAMEHVKSGTLRALAVTASKRWGDLPDIPTVAEFLPGYEAYSWFGVAAPKNIPTEIVLKLNEEINAALVDLKIKSRIAELGASTLPGSPADFGKLIAEETEKWGKVIRAANIKAE